MSAAARPARMPVALATLAALLVLAFADLAASGGINPFTVPPPLALGSGQAPGGAHCAVAP